MEGQEVLLGVLWECATKNGYCRTLLLATVMSTHSLESLGDSDSDIFSDDEIRMAQEEWDESVAQLQLVISVVMLPVLGKWLGRRWSQWGTSRLCSLA